MLRDPADGLDGDCILAESPGDLGLLLWRTVRDVSLWATTPEEARRTLFSEGSAAARLRILSSAELPGRAAAPVDTIHAMLADARHRDAELVSLCCLEVAAWARDAVLPHTATAFAQAGALAAPESGDAALFTGMCAQAAGQTARAETWLRRTVAISRRERNRPAYVSALVELGALRERRGNWLRAERFYRRAMRASRRFGVRAERMRAAHGLFRLYRRNGDEASAAQFALSAQRAYDADAAGADSLLLDLVRFWVELGEPRRAGVALRSLGAALLTTEPVGQLAVLALTARARARREHPHSGSAAWRAAWVLLADNELPEAARYRAALDLAHAAHAGGDRQSFQWARRVVLRLAPQTEYPVVAALLEKLWPNGGTPQLERAS